MIIKGYMGVLNQWPRRQLICIASHVTWLFGMWRVAGRAVLHRSLFTRHILEEPGHPAIPQPGGAKSRPLLAL